MHRFSKHEVNMKICFYEPNGFITGFLSSDEETIALNKSLQSNWIDGEWNGKTHYVLEGEATERPINPATLDNLTLNNLPVPCKISINGTEYDIDESEVELDLPMVNEYLIRVIAFPYLDAEFTIET